MHAKHVENMSRTATVTKRQNDYPGCRRSLDVVLNCWLAETRQREFLRAPDVQAGTPLDFGVAS